MDLALRLKSMEKAMADVIVPALEGSNALAVEQAYFVLFHIRLIATQFDKDLHFKLAELREIASCAHELIEAFPPSPTGAAGTPVARTRELLGASAACRSLQVPSRDEVTEMIRKLKGAVDVLLRDALAGKDPAVARAATLITMRYSERDVTRRRVWVKDAGYDLEAASLPALEQVLR
jgi:hypothetical protein